MRAQAESAKYYGIYLGDGKVCEKLDGELPAEMSIMQFLRDESEFSVALYHNDSPDAREDTVAIAKMAIVEYAPFEVLAYNSKQFARFCRLADRPTSKSAVAAEAVVGAAVGATGGLIL